MDFINKNKRYLIAGGAILAFFVIIVIAGGKGDLLKKKAQKKEIVKTEFHKNDDKQVRKLLDAYYDAYAKGSEKKLSQVAAPISENEMSYIKLFSEYIDKISINDVYCKQGVDSNSLLVSVELTISFNDVKTKAPGLDFFYITGVETGEMYIVNLYSQFNDKTKEYAIDSEIEKTILAYENESQVRKLQDKVQKKYDEAILQDEALDEMINSTIEGAVSQWMSTINLVQNQTPPQFALAGDEDDSDKKDDDQKDDDKKDDDKKDDEGDDKATQEVKKVTVKEIVETIDKVNLREGASTNTDSLGQIRAGIQVTVIKMNTWGDWTYVKTKSGKKGYIRNDFLKTVDTEYTVAGQPGYPEKNQKLELTDSTNLLNKMKKSGKVISSLSAGTKVKVITCYANGYSKVMSNGRTGYILTALLKLKD